VFFQDRPSRCFSDDRTYLIGVRLDLTMLNLSAARAGYRLKEVGNGSFPRSGPSPFATALKVDFG
jgi:hypothetical protein